MVFWDEETLPLVGAVTLEILSLGIDPVNRRLIPEDALLLPALARHSAWRHRNGDADRLYIAQ